MLLHKKSDSASARKEKQSEKWKSVDRKVLVGYRLYYSLVLPLQEKISHYSHLEKSRFPPHRTDDTNVRKSSVSLFFSHDNSYEGYVHEEDSY